MDDEETKIIDKAEIDIVNSSILAAMPCIVCEAVSAALGTPFRCDIHKDIR